MKHKTHSTFEAFNRDVAANAGYLYTTYSRLSSRMANRRLTDAALAAIDLRGKRVIDIGCGDGTYTAELLDYGQPASLCGVDPAQEAIEVARQRFAHRSITFAVHGAYELPYADSSFDVAHLRGVLHHLDRPVDALQEAMRVARLLLIIEPNGYNPVLKLIERTSAYHCEHHEKSYSPIALNRWVRALGGEVRSRQWVGLVPFFCPDWMARALKVVEPLVESCPVIRTCGCGVYVMIAARRTGSPSGAV